MPARHKNTVAQRRRARERARENGAPKLSMNDAARVVQKAHRANSGRIAPAPIEAHVVEARVVEARVVAVARGRRRAGAGAAEPPRRRRADPSRSPPGRQRAEAPGPPATADRQGQGPGGARPQGPARRARADRRSKGRRRAALRQETVRLGTGTQDLRGARATRESPRHGAGDDRVPRGEPARARSTGAGRTEPRGATRTGRAAKSFSERTARASPATGAGTA